MCSIVRIRTLTQEVCADQSEGAVNHVSVKPGMELNSGTHSHAAVPGLQNQPSGGEWRACQRKIIRGQTAVALTLLSRVLLVPGYWCWHRQVTHTFALAMPGLVGPV